MRDPLNMHSIVDYAGDIPTVIKMDEIPQYDLSDYDLNDERSFKKYIENIEKDVRGSFEYKQFVKYLRENMDMNKCSFYQNVTNVDTTKIAIEIHHEPLSLFDICLIVHRKRVAFNEPLDEEYVAKEVMYLHYNLWIGLIPLAETVHELVHNQYLFVPTSKVLGQYRTFVESYKPYMLPEQLEVLERIEGITFDYEEDYKTLLSRQYIYVDMSGAYELPKVEDLTVMIKEHIKVIMDKNNALHK